MHSLRARTHGFLLAAVLAACAPGQTPQAPPPGSPDAAPTPPMPPDPCGDTCLPLDTSQDLHPYAQRLNDVFQRHYAAQQSLSYEALLARHELPYLQDIGIDPSQAEHHAAFVSAFGLSTAAQDVLDRLGFVVVPAPPALPLSWRPDQTTAAGPGDTYYRIFAADLPVYVTADSILHAWHRSFGKLLEGAETYILVDTMRQVLAKTTAHLAGVDGEAARDALFYASVARALLEPAWAPPTSVGVEVQSFLALIAGEQMVDVDFLGAVTRIDFSQLRPRGHYTRSEALQRYFRAVMWLGRVDLVLDPRGEEPRPREEAAARMLANAIEQSGAAVQLELVDSFYAGFVGQGNALTPKALLALCAQAGLPSCVGDASAMTALYAEQPAPAYSSRVFASATPPLTMRFFPQRFAYDAWVTSRTTTPRLEPSDVQGGRAMAMPEDVAYALGNPRALTYFADDMLEPYRENLPAVLEATRLTMDELAPSALESTAYTHWLEALRAVSAPHLDETLPKVLRTAAWHDRKLESVLASWAELRHDTVLAVEQSVGGNACQYPHGFVDPVPELYRSVARSAAALEPVFRDLETRTDAGGASFFDTVPGYLTYVQDTMERLAVIAEKELAGTALSADDLAFLDRTVDEHAEDSYYGTRQYDGWYPRLFWELLYWSADDVRAGDFDHPSVIADPLVVDVHTDAEKQQVLEAGVGYPGLLVIALDRGDGVVLYGGPVSSFYSFHQPLGAGRLTDEQWRTQVESAAVPERPAFARQYWVE